MAQKPLPREVIFGEEARNKVLAGVAVVARAVGCTMGPCGRFVLMDRDFFPTVTRDGVSVAKDISLADPYEDMGCKLVKESAEKTNNQAGDGTTATVVLIHEMTSLGFKELGEGRNSMQLKKGMNYASEKLEEILKNMAAEVKDKKELQNIATISANDKEIGEAVADLIYDLGEGAVVSVALSNKPNLEIERVEGLQFDAGFILPHFINQEERRKCLLDNPYIYLCEGRIRDIADILPIMEKVGSTANRTLLVVCDEMTNPALNFFVSNCTDPQQNFAGCVVQTPEFGARRRDFLEDVAIVTGGKVCSNVEGMTAELFPLESLGRADGIVVGMFNTTIVGGAGEESAIKGRVEEMKQLSDEGYSDFDREKLQERTARITNGIAIIHVSGATDVEQKETIYRVEDSLNATKAAWQEGIVPGGGVALIRAMQEFEAQDHAYEHEDFKVGVDIVLSSLTSCASRIAHNSGAESLDIVEKVKESKGNQGYNALTGVFEDLVEAKVVDPVKVMRCALKNSVSTASMFIIAEAAITDDRSTASSGFTEDEMRFMRNALRR